MNRQATIAIMAAVLRSRHDDNEHSIMEAMDIYDATAEQIEEKDAAT